MNKDDDKLTTGQAAEVANVHRKTILNWIYGGHLKAARLPGKKGRYRIAPDDLDKVIEEYVPKPRKPKPSKAAAKAVTGQQNQLKRQPTNPFVHPDS